MKLRRNESYDNDHNSVDTLYKEQFREQAIERGVADDCVIDKPTYAEISCVTGCFKFGKTWIVYDTDERAQVFGEKKYTSPKLAYTDLANRLGFSYIIPKLEPMTYPRSTVFAPVDALELVCVTSKAKFDETVEIHIKLGVDSRHANQQIRGAIVLPNGTGKNKRVLVFAKNEKIDEAIEAGADYVGGMDYVDRITKEHWFDFDVIVATPDMMGVVGRLSRVLGPKGLMPSPKAGTVTPNVGAAVRDIKNGKIEYRLDKSNIIHCPIGKVSFGPNKLVENYSAIMDAVIKSKPASVKGQYIRSCFVASTMGSSVKVKT